jgi:uncharacterized membrane protein (UPF0127 family)
VRKLNKTPLRGFLSRRVRNESATRAIFPIKSSLAVPIIIAIAIVIVVVVALVVGESKPKSSAKPKTQASTSCGPYRDDVNVRIGERVFKTELAKTASEQAKGLGGRPCIGPNQAMLFAFSKPGQYRFWMKDMKFPIDILWIDSAKRVVAQEIDVEPSTYHSSNPFFENDPNHLAQFVLEVEANTSTNLHITLGTPVTL